MELGIARYVTVSGTLGRAVEEQGLLNPKKLRVIHNGIEAGRYRREGPGQLRSRLGLPADAVLAVSVGNLHPAKGYDVLLRSAALLGLDHPSLHFVIAGAKKSALMAQLDALAAELGVSQRVHFVGFVDNTAEFLSEADVFVLSSLSEGFSIATIEAMAAGVPVVATRSGGPEEIVEDGLTALLVAPGDADALATAISALVTDKATARRISAEASRLMTDRFGVSKMIDDYIALYREQWDRHGS